MNILIMRYVMKSCNIVQIIDISETCHQNIQMNCNYNAHVDLFCC